MVEAQTTDSFGGGYNNLCAQAPEWIVSGYACVRNFDMLPPSSIMQLTDVFPAKGIENITPIALPKQYPASQAFLLPPGFYFLEDDKLIAARDDSDKSNKNSVEEKFYLRKTQVLSSHQANRAKLYWTGIGETSWDQETRVSDGKTLLFLETKTPVLIIRATPNIGINNTLFVRNVKTNRREKDVEVVPGEWNFFPQPEAGFDKPPQSFEICYAEPMPFEFRFAPDETLRKAVPLRKVSGSN